MTLYYSLVSPAPKSLDAYRSCSTIRPLLSCHILLALVHRSELGHCHEGLRGLVSSISSSNALLGLYANTLPQQVFALLMSEMALFMLLILPLPYTMKRRLFTFISESPIVAKLQYGLKAGLPTVMLRGMA